MIEVFSRLVTTHGTPAHLRSDNGPEFVSRTVLQWLEETGIATELNVPGKQSQNGADESFNGKFRDECLSLKWFRHRIDAKHVIEQWPQHYNELWPHSILGYRRPAQFKWQLPISGSGHIETREGALLQ